MMNQETLARKRWEVIKQSVFLTGRTVLDIGCWHADLATLIVLESAPQYVVATEGDVDRYLEAQSRVRKKESEVPGMAERVIISHTSPEDFGSIYPGRFDVSICANLLGVTQDPDALLEWCISYVGISIFGVHSKDQSLIDHELFTKNWLSTYRWSRILNLGSFIPEDTPETKQTLWMCER